MRACALSKRIYETPYALLVFLQESYPEDLKSSKGSEVTQNLEEN